SMGELRIENGELRISWVAAYKIYKTYKTYNKLTSPLPGKFVDSQMQIFYLHLVIGNVENFSLYIACLGVWVFAFANYLY
ncbi:MAG: hypothetical protein K2K49_01630, partial [Duncaniella sp.]|nr:hypothetical protein [Duncaniella sp.]